MGDGSTSEMWERACSRYERATPSFTSHRLQAGSHLPIRKPAHPPTPQFIQYPPPFSSPPTPTPSSCSSPSSAGTSSSGANRSDENPSSC